MPKLRYDESKGLVQEPGSGLDLTKADLADRIPVVELTDLTDAGVLRPVLKLSESGTTFLIPRLTGGGPQTIDLPALCAESVGVTYRFINLAGAATQIFSLDTTVAGDKIVLAAPDGDGTVTVNTFNKVRMTTAARLGASFEIKCISTTQANAWLVSDITSGIGNATGEHVGAN